MSAKRLNEKVENCNECDVSFWEDDEHWMGGNGWLRCRKLGRRIVHECWNEGIDPDCPLDEDNSESTKK